MAKPVKNPQGNRSRRLGGAAIGKAARLGASNGDTIMPWSLTGPMDELRELENELATARAQAETAEARYRELFDLNPDAHLLTDIRGVISEANLAASVLVDVPAQYLMGKPLAVYVAMEDRPSLRETIRRMKINDTAELTVRITPRGMSPRSTSIRVAAVRDETNRTLMGLRWVIRDVTEARAAQDEIASSREKLRELTSELSLAEERVRREIAVGIHDRVSQPLALAKMLLGKIKGVLDGDSRRDVEELNLFLQQAIDESRTLTFELSPPVLYELGLPAAVEWLAEQMQRRHGVKIRTVTGNFARPIRIDLRVLLFQAIRELLTNIIKHANARSAIVAIRSENQTAQVTVSDDGTGFNPATSASKPALPGGFGLFSIRTRVERVGGQFTVDSKPKRGTRITMMVPLPDAAGTASADRSAALP